MNTRSEAKLRKARLLLQAAELLGDCGFNDAVVSLSASAGINGSDALLSQAGLLTEGRASHAVAVTQLRKLGHDSTAQQLQQLLGLKNKSQYGDVSCTDLEAASALKRAQRIVEASKNAE